MGYSWWKIGTRKPEYYALPRDTTHTHTYGAIEVVGGAHIRATAEVEVVRVRAIRGRRTTPIVAAVARVVELSGIIPKVARTGKLTTAV